MLLDIITFSMVLVYLYIYVEYLIKFIKHIKKKIRSKKNDKCKSMQAKLESN